MKKRLDVLCVERGLAASREKAKAIIMSGIVYVDGVREDKAGTSFDETSVIEVRGTTLKYVSRGGLKLEKAMEVFELDLDGLTCLDVGRGQLDWKLRNDPRVTCMEKTNIRYVVPEDIGVAADFSSIDVSFISLVKVLGPVRDLLKDDGRIVCLIKPQFEAGREKVGKHGVVRDENVHREVILKVRDYAESIGLTPIGLDYSPIKGPEGNIEYLMYLCKGDSNGIRTYSIDVDSTVQNAHGALDH